MEIRDIKNRWIKIGKSSITVKNDETGKTAGVVRNITRFTDLQANKKMDYYKMLRESGVWGSGNASNVVIDTEGNIFYIYNTNGLQMQKEHFPEAYNKKMNFINKVEEYMEVVPVQF